MGRKSIRFASSCQESLFVVNSVMVVVLALALTDEEENSSKNNTNEKQDS